MKESCENLVTRGGGERRGKKKMKRKSGSLNKKTRKKKRDQGSWRHEVAKTPRCDKGGGRRNKKDLRVSVGATKKKRKKRDYCLQADKKKRKHTRQLGKYNCGFTTKKNHGPPEIRREQGPRDGSGPRPKKWGKKPALTKNLLKQ